MNSLWINDINRIRAAIEGCPTDTPSLLEHKNFLIDFLAQMDAEANQTLKERNIRWEEGLSDQSPEVPYKQLKRLSITANNIKENATDEEMIAMYAHKCMKRLEYRLPPEMIKQVAEETSGIFNKIMEENGVLPVKIREKWEIFCDVYDSCRLEEVSEAYHAKLFELKYGDIQAVESVACRQLSQITNGLITKDALEKLRALNEILWQDTISEEDKIRFLDLTITLRSTIEYLKKNALLPNLTREIFNQLDEANREFIKQTKK